MATLQGCAVVTPWGPITLPERPGHPRSGPVTVVLRPDAVRLDPTGILHGTVTSRRFLGDHVLLGVSIGDLQGAAGIPAAEGAEGGQGAEAVPMPPLEVEAREPDLPGYGRRVTLAIDPAGVLILPPEAGG